MLKSQEHYIFQVYSSLPPHIHPKYFLKNTPFQEIQESHWPRWDTACVGFSIIKKQKSTTIANCVKLLLTYSNLQVADANKNNMKNIPIIKVRNNLKNCNRFMRSA